MTYRHPELLASVATTLDVLSGGRATLGHRRGLVRPRAPRPGRSSESRPPGAAGPRAVLRLAEVRLDGREPRTDHRPRPGLTAAPVWSGASTTVGRADEAYGAPHHA
ncbi:hypothetical protein [Streptomyces sp. UG1]|uniref:hypothetical protein n=1 Tax=Streptomyces sp. UG1 TaxID=3417652 RepID=UPI003CEC334D